MKTETILNRALLLFLTLLLCILLLPGSAMAAERRSEAASSLAEQSAGSLEYVSEGSSESVSAAYTETDSREEMGEPEGAAATQEMSSENPQEEETEESGSAAPEVPSSCSEEMNTYTIRFSANQGKGSVPQTIRKTGTDSTVDMGRIGAEVPTRSGYTFCGWSALRGSSVYRSPMRIAYSEAQGGRKIAGDTAAHIVQGPLSYAQYCTYTGGNSSSTTLTLYAQWIKDTEIPSELSIQVNGISTLRKGSSCQISGHAESNYTITSLEFFIFSGKESLGVFSMRSNTLTLDLSSCGVNDSLHFESLPAGTYILMVKAKDESGKMLTQEIEFTVTD